MSKLENPDLGICILAVFTFLCFNSCNFVSFHCVICRIHIFQLRLWHLVVILSLVAIFKFFYLLLVYR